MNTNKNQTTQRVNVEPEARLTLPVCLLGFQISLLYKENLHFLVSGLVNVLLSVHVHICEAPYLKLNIESKYKVLICDTFLEITQNNKGCFCSRSVRVKVTGQAMLSDLLWASSLNGQKLINLN